MPKDVHSGAIIRDRFLVQERIGAGIASIVYVGLDRKTGKKVAIKIEENDFKPHGEKGGLQIENLIYGYLNSFEPVKGFASLLYYGEKDAKHQVLIMDLLGNDMEKERQSCPGKKMPLDDVVVFGLQALRRIQYLHVTGFVHRDIKPENFLTSPDVDVTEFFLADFGLAKLYMVPDIENNCQKHMELPDKLGPSIGSRNFGTIRTLDGVEPSRRDDLESLLYCLIYLHKGVLPWSVFEGSHDISNTEYYDQIEKVKRRIVAIPSAVCNGMPPEFIEIFNHVNQLNFKDDPDYDLLETLLQKVLCTTETTSEEEPKGDLPGGEAGGGMTESTSEDEPKDVMPVDGTESSMQVGEVEGEPADEPQFKSQYQPQGQPEGNVADQSEDQVEDKPRDQVQYQQQDLPKNS